MTRCPGSPTHAGFACVGVVVTRRSDDPIREVTIINAMECYRCGTPVEEQTTFCPSCNAPQIRVSVPAGFAVNQPATAPLPPGTPASIEPPAVPLHFAPPTPINWKKFLRSALPFCLLAGISIIVYAPLGLLAFIACVMVAVGRYRRDHSGALTRTQGAKLGAVAGVLSFVPPLIEGTVALALQFAEYRRQVELVAQQRLGNNPDPLLQRFAHWFTSTQGIVFGIIFSMVVLLVVVAIVSSLAGAVSAAGFANRSRR